MTAYYRVVGQRLDSAGRWSELFTTEDAARDRFDTKRDQYEEDRTPMTLTLEYHDKNGKVRCLEVY